MSANLLARGYSLRGKIRKMVKVVQDGDNRLRNLTAMPIGRERIVNIDILSLAVDLSETRFRHENSREGLTCHASTM